MREEEKEREGGRKEYQSQQISLKVQRIFERKQGTHYFTVVKGVSAGWEGHIAGHFLDSPLIPYQ